MVKIKFSMCDEEGLSFENEKYKAFTYYDEAYRIRQHDGEYKIEINAKNDNGYIELNISEMCSETHNLDAVNAFLSFYGFELEEIL